ncbi:MULTISPECIES: carboxymuconolactone decarboxylase family protein [unclassified Streptomyces]|uniref:carboxymuconolactone decarboxylase family protein n=1 Tax=unclassified Streptomyces TaxID=2593676 RepID=UPI002256ABA8|nr:MULTISPECIES: carboxymuconolactone decarboxylase family protein [unclassified Streptomyces]MCX5334683.1 carboxymuconolactone decarboxylase family protein [Streptomyces sp. NBC_00140]MCX5364177.1 carboxymuconolactone decarboxylase family protein [Streptomyces sp. NBC_00124]
MARIPYPEHPADGVAKLPVPLNAFRMLSHAPPLTDTAIDLGLAVLLESTLPVRLRELVIMAVAAGTECAYEAAQHRPIALNSGVSEAQLTAIAELRSSGPEFDPAESAAVAATFELVSRHTLSEGVLTALRASFADRQVVEIVTTVGYYVMLAGLMNGLGVDVDPSGEQFLGLTGDEPG